MTNNFNQLPLELQSIITNKYNVKQSRLISKNILKANKLKYCTNVIHVTSHDIDDLFNYNKPFIIYTTLDHSCKWEIDDEVYATIYNDQLNYEFYISFSDNYDNIQYSFYPNPITSEPLENRCGKREIPKDVDLLSYYYILQNRGCDDLIKNYSKKTVLDKLKLKFKHFNDYDYFARQDKYNIYEIIKIHLYFITNALIMGLVDIKDINMLNDQGLLLDYDHIDNLNFLLTEINELYIKLYDYIIKID